MSLLALGGLGLWLRLVETCFDKRLEVSAVSRLFHFFDWNETERCGIDAVTKAGRPRTIVENMAEVGIGGLRANLSAHHTMSAVVTLDDFFISEGLAETGPAATGIEFIQRTEQRFARDDVDVKAGFVIVPEFVVEGRLGIGVLGHFELHRSELLFQFVGRWFLKI